MVTAVRLDKMSAVPVIAPEYLKPILRLPLRLDKRLLFQLFHLRIKSRFVPMSNRKNTKKKVLFLPVSVHPLGDRVLSNYLASKTIRFRQSHKLLVNFFRNGGAFIGNVVRQWA